MKPHEDLWTILPNIKHMSTYETKLRNMRPYATTALLNIFCYVSQITSENFAADDNILRKIDKLLSTRTIKKLTKILQIDPEKPQLGFIRLI